MKNQHIATSHKRNDELGLSIIEIIIAVALFSIIAVVALVSVGGSFTTNRLGEEQTQATAYAQAGLEAARSIRNQGWDTSFLTINCAAGCGISDTNSYWEWSGSDTVVDQFTRTITVEGVQRDVSGNIVSSGGTDDPDTKKVTSTVTWQFAPNRNNAVSLSTYLTNFTKLITPPIGDWTQPTQTGQFDISGGNDALGVRVQGDYAYIIRSSGNPRFVVLNISDPLNPIQTSILSLNNRSHTNLFVSGNYAYLVGTTNNSEVSVIDISNPANPSEVDVVNISGNADARGVALEGTNLYVSRASSGADELYIYDASTPSNLSQISSLGLNGSANRVLTSGNYAFISSTDNAQEFQVVSISNPASPSLATTLNLPGNTDAFALSLMENYAFVSQANTLHAIDISNPLAPTLVDSITVGSASIEDISLETAGPESFLFIATSDTGSEFAVVSVTDPTNLSVAATIDNPGNDALRGVSYSDTYDITVAVGNANNEVFIYEPN